MRAALVALLFVTATGAAQADWKKDLKDAAKQQAGAKLEQTLGLPNPAPPGAGVYFINVKNGATIASPVLIQFGLRGAGISPAGLQSTDTGHHVLLIDDPQFDATLALPLDNPRIKHFDKGQTEGSVSLTPGTHTLQLLLADWKQQSFNPAVVSERITVTVGGSSKK